MAVRFLAAALAMAGVSFLAAAAAQEEERRSATQPVTYEDQVVELGRVLGGAHYLRILCNGRGDQRWRDYMREVMSREHSSSRALSAAFNEGFRREEMRFSVCGRASEQMEAELRAQGLRLAGALAARNAGGATGVAEGEGDRD
jgi:uncharacterized protein (TIGR02301 family)